MGDLEEKRARHNADAERHKKLRDELNDKTKEWAEKRDDLNSQVRKFIDEANARRDMRDKLNAEVREAKAQRDEWNHKFNDLSSKVMALRREKMPKSGLSLRKFKAELRALEKKHMTSVLSTDKERVLVEEISELSNKIGAMEKEIEQFSEVKQAEKDARDAKDNAENFHRKVSELAEKAQIEHDSMLKLYDEADKHRKEADSAQEEFIKTKLAADEQHREHIEHIRQVHDFDKIISGIRDRTRKARKEKDDTSAKKEADEIFQKFRSGEKLSTEDIMVLQKSGYM
ncbi:MAG: phosphoserine phosphatase [Euryarchaeota archaeon RBG_19FT_COMBO_56_21]|nr:MAG: phosphoserine phosphatase [Euryarchaeota archaeon RBG_19FT_COMBO_56_21]